MSSLRRYGSMVCDKRLVWRLFQGEQGLFSLPSAALELSQWREVASRCWNFFWSRESLERESRTDLEILEISTLWPLLREHGGMFPQKSRIWQTHFNYEENVEIMTY